MKSREVKTIIYTSEDGKDFTNKDACIKHEKRVEFHNKMKLKHGSIFIVFMSSGSNELSEYIRNAEAFSTMELAKLSLVNLNESELRHYKIMEVDIDFRFWNEEHIRDQS